MLNFLICEDSLSILDKLSQMLNSIFVFHDYQAKVTLKATTANEVIEHVQNNKTDILLLDIRLNDDMSGLELAEEVRRINKNCYIIFITGHLEYAMMAYKYKTFDYIPKPITTERLEETLERLFDDVNGLPKKYLRIDNKNTIIDEDEIHYIRKDGMKLIFHTNSRTYETYSSFKKIQTDLPNNFIRCHKSCIVNINQIENVEPTSNTIFFKNQSFCEIGPKYKPDFMEVLKNAQLFE